MEILVVDNSSTDGTEAVVENATRAAPFPVSYFRKENKGPAASRNYGIARAQGDVFAFTDSDCRMDSTWVSTAIAHLMQDVGLVAGPVRPVNNPDRLPGFFAHQTDHSTEDFVYPTANVFYRREVIERVGGFHEGFGAYPWGTPVGGEDTDLAWRSKRAGYRSVFAVDAPVYHEATDLSLTTWLVEPVRAQIMPRLVREFPELRDGLWCRYFLSRRNAEYYLLLAGALAALARRQPGFLLLGLPWVLDLMSMVERDLPRPRRWWRMPIKYALMAERYFVESSALIVSSIRHRRPVL
jgi:GT2 family glycosyltransferase